VALERGGRKGIIGAVTEAEEVEVKSEVERLRLRLDEQGSIVRRTNVAVTTLADSLGQVLASQRRRERHLNLNSFVAYLLFTVLLGGGFFLLFRSRAGELMGDRNRAVAERDALRDKAATLETELAAREAAAQSAAGFYQLLQEDRRTEVIARFPEIERDKLTPTERAIFTAGEKQARAGLVDAGYLAGIDAFRAGDQGKAAEELKRALAYEEEGPRAAQMRYYLGVTLYKTGDHEEAARQLELALAGRVDQTSVTDCRYYLAAALEAIGKYDEARAEYDRYASAKPASPLAVHARRKAAALARRASPTN
jgi:TolA-binding protein